MSVAIIVVPCEIEEESLASLAGALEGSIAAAVAEAAVQGEVLDVSVVPARTHSVDYEGGSMREYHSSENGYMILVKIRKAPGSMSTPGG